MPNPFLIAAKGKGVRPMLERMGAIALRYGLTTNKMKKALNQLVGVLDEYHCRASLPVTSMVIVRHPGLMRAYHELGIELAVHGYAHLDYSSMSLTEQLDHFTRARAVFEREGISPSGFRCPYLRWNTDTLKALAACGFTWDSSQALTLDVVGRADTEAYHHVQGFYRARPAAVYPLLPTLEEGLVRIPYCLPDDEALVERLKLTCAAPMSEMWLAMLERIYQDGEVFTIGLHPERAPLCSDSLRAVLARARALSPAVWIARLDEIAGWYLSLGQATFQAAPETSARGEACLRVQVHAPARAALLARGLELEAPTHPWAQGYVAVEGREARIPGERRPWIGLSPACPPNLERFLRHQGYLVERAAGGEAFSYWLDTPTFTAEDGRPLINSLECDPARPLLRLGRWPDGAKAVISVTGDIDEVSLVDYGLRMFAR